MIGKLIVAGVRAVAKVVTSKGEVQMDANGQMTLDGQPCKPESAHALRTDNGRTVTFDEPVLQNLNETIHPAALYNQLGDGLTFDPDRQEARFSSANSAGRFAELTGWTTWNHDGSYCSISE